MEENWSILFEKTVTFEITRVYAGRDVHRAHQRQGRDEAGPTQRREIRAGDGASRDDLLFMLPPHQLVLVGLDSRQRHVLDRY